jgi:hypothetical protein
LCRSAAPLLLRALITVLVLAVPRAAAHTPLTCHAAGGEWLRPTETYPAACMFSANRRN